MKSKRVGGRTYRIQEVEVVRRRVPTQESPLECVVGGIRQLRRHVAFNWSQAEHQVGVVLDRIRQDFKLGIGKRLPRFAAPTTTQHVFAVTPASVLPKEMCGRTGDLAQVRVTSVVNCLDRASGRNQETHLACPYLSCSQTERQVDLHQARSRDFICDMASL